MGIIPFRLAFGSIPTQKRRNIRISRKARPKRYGIKQPR
jgi:hypothetical protein